MSQNAVAACPQHILVDSFTELGATGAILRTILLRDRYFAGYRFRCGEVQAVQLAGEEVVKFYDVEQNLLKTVSFNAAESNAPEEAEEKKAA